MKNKLQSLKSHLRNLKLIHILLIILILVVFFGLFKKEVAVNSPRIMNREIFFDYPCKKEVDNPKYTGSLEKEVLDKCGSSGSVSFQCYMSLAGDKVLSPQTTTGDKELPPQKVEKNTTCVGSKLEKWFWAFGRYWFKFGL